MTDKLYYESSHRKDFEAQVISCEPEGEGYKVVLDKTVFFPEGGGQYADTGILGGVHVLDAQEKDGIIYHYTDGALTPGEIVKGEIDWEKRFESMQQHSGEHIISGIVHGRFGYNNVGFHLGADYCTMDFDGPITKEQLKEIEEEANRIVYKNLNIEILYPTKEELKDLTYRSKIEIEGQVRIVNIPGVDICACCGTHVTRTGEIGMVKLLSVVKFREGVRMEMLSGKRVLDYLNMVNDQNRQVSMKLSAKIGETAAAVARLQDENFRLKGQVNHMFDELCTVEAKNWEGAGSVLLFHEGLEADQVRRMADAVMQKCSGCCAVFSANGDGSYKYAIGEQNGDLRQFTKEMNAALNGRGGGKPFFVQGSVKASEDEIRQFFRQ